MLAYALLARAALAAVLLDAATPRPPLVSAEIDVVQTDVVVTDANGRHVTDLTAADFELHVDGRPRELTHCRYVAFAPSALAADERPSPENVGRVFAWIVDDAGLSLDSNDAVKRALTSFVEEVMQPGDLVAIGRTGRGQATRLLQQFTTDKALLRAAIRDFGRNPATGGPRIPTRGPRTRLMRAEQSSSGIGGALLPAGEEYASFMPALMQLVHTRDMLQDLGTIVTAMSELPGRKALVLLSDRLSLLDGTARPARRDEPPVIDPALLEGVHVISELANRLSVVIHAVAPGGRQLHELDPNARVQRRSGESDGLGLLSARTGGLYVRSGGDARRALDRVVADQQGYYLLGYVPDETLGAASAGPPFHHLDVRVKRPGLLVRSRAGHLAVRQSQLERTPALATRLWAAAASPLALNGLDVHAAALFGHDDGGAPKEPRPVIRGRAEVAGITPGASGVEVDLMALVLDDTGKPIHQIDRSQMRAAVTGAGLHLEFDAPVNRAGLHQVRLAVRDAATGRLGSAACTVDVPDLSKGRLALSGLAVAAGADGKSIDYTTLVYNTRERSTPDAAPLDIRVRLRRDGREIAHLATARVTPAEVAHRPKRGRRHLVVAGHLEAAEALTPGTYVVDVTVRDPAASEKEATSSSTRVPIRP